MNSGGEHTDRAALLRAARLMTKARDAFYERRYEECIERCQESLGALLPPLPRRRPGRSRPRRPRSRPTASSAPTPGCCRWSRPSASRGSSPSSCGARRGSATSAGGRSPAATGGSSSRSPARRPPRCSPPRGAPSRRCSAGAAAAVTGPGSAAASAAPAAALLGFLSVAAQAILARELLVVFHGSELALGLVLAVWLLLGGAGSALAARALGGRRPGARGARRGRGRCRPLAPRRRSSARVGPPPFSRLRRGRSPGSGTARSRRWRCSPPRPPRVAPGSRSRRRSAATRAGRGAPTPGSRPAGSPAGRLSPLAFAAGTVDAFTLAAAVAAATLAAAAWLVARGGGAHCARVLAAGLAALRSPLALAGPLGGLAARSQAARWPGLELLAARDGRHGNAALARVAGQVTLFANGEPAFSFPDPESAETAAHLPLLAAPRVARVLLTAEALGGALAEALKHPVTAVDVVVADPDVLPLVLPQLPAALAAALEDPRVRLRHGDLRAWVAAHPRRLRRRAPRLASSRRAPSPTGWRPGSSSRSCGRALRPGGVAALSLSSSPNYLGPELRLRNASVARALAAAFPRVEVLRAESAHAPRLGRAGSRSRDPGPPRRAAAGAAASRPARSRPRSSPRCSTPSAPRAPARELRETRAAENRDARAGRLPLPRPLPRGRRRPPRRGLARRARRSRRAGRCSRCRCSSPSLAAAPGGGAARRRAALAVAAAVDRVRRHGAAVPALLRLPDRPGAAVRRSRGALRDLHGGARRRRGAGAAAAPPRHPAAAAARRGPGGARRPARRSPARRSPARSPRDPARCRSPPTCSPAPSPPGAALCGGLRVRPAHALRPPGRGRAGAGTTRSTSPAPPPARCSPRSGCCRCSACRRRSPSLRC